MERRLFGSVQAEGGYAGGVLSGDHEDLDVRVVCPTEFCLVGCHHDGGRRVCNRPFQEDEAHLVFGQARFQVVDVVIDQHNVIRTYNDDAIIRADRGVGQAGQRLHRQL